MTRTTQILPLLIALSAVALPVSAMGTALDGRPVRNSFIDRPVGNTADLIAHVKADAVVTDRYVRHFAMNRAAVLQFLGGLHRGKLAEEGIYTIYSVPPGGKIKMHVGRIRKGEPMFLDRSDRPVLVAKCGNPIVLGPARPKRGNPFSIVPTETEALRVIEPDETVAEMVGQTLLAEAPEPEPEDESAAMAIVPPDAPEPVAPTVPAYGLGGGSSLGSLSFFLPFLEMGGNYSHGSHPGHPRPVNPPIPVPPNPVPPNPVPEPASMVALATAASLYGRKRRK